MRFSFPVLTIVLTMFSTAILSAQEADAIKSQNWDRIATAIVRFKADAMTDGVKRQSALYGAFSDLNVDGVPEIFAFTDPAACVPEECGTTVYSLIGEQFVDMLEDGNAAKRGPITAVRILNDTANRYYDLGFGDAVLSFDGSHYVDAKAAPRGDFDFARFTPACEALPDSDYTLESKGVVVKDGRAKLCACIGERLAVLGYGQADTAILVEKFGRQVDENYDNDFSDADALHKVIAQADDTRNSCTVQNGWSAWTFKLGEDDEKTPQLALEFASFIPNCGRQDWLISEKKIGSADRALSMCGCVARKLAARGYDQATLDAIGKLYAWEINDDELAAINGSAADQSDEDMQSCLNGMPAR